MKAEIANEFKVIPGYSKYSTNGKVVKNVSTNKVQSVKTGTDKFQLFADNGQRNTLNLEKINGLFPVVEVQKAEAPKESKKAVLKEKFSEVKPRAVKVKTVTTPEGMKLIREDLMRRDDVKRVVEESFFKGHAKIYRLHKMGLTNKEIQAVLGKRAEVVSRDLWLYSKGKLKLEA